MRFSFKECEQIVIMTIVSMTISSHGHKLLFSHEIHVFCVPITEIYDQFVPAKWK